MGTAAARVLGAAWRVVRSHPGTRVCTRSASGAALRLVFLDNVLFKLRDPYEVRPMRGGCGLRLPTHISADGNLVSLRESEHRLQAGERERASDRASRAGSGDAGACPGICMWRDCGARIWGTPSTLLSVPGHQSLGKHTHLRPQVPRIKDLARSFCLSVKNHVIRSERTVERDHILFQGWNRN